MNFNMNFNNKLFILVLSAKNLKLKLANNFTWQAQITQIKDKYT